MEDISFSPDLSALITTEQAWHYFILPYQINDDSLSLYISEKLNVNQLLPELKLLFSKQVNLIPVKHELIIHYLQRYYQKQNTTVIINEVNADTVEDLINEAIELSSSDIHIEHYENTCRIRYRIDGKLIERYVLPEDLYPAYINKIKLASELDIAEKRLPQDGRIFHIDSKGNDIDIRVSTMPSLYGEKIVMRILSKDATEISLDSLGMSKQQYQTYLKGIKKPHGLVLISGPTGSGKTTTLYASLKLLNKKETNILTIEDPIEYTLEGINQVQLKESIGLDFVRALRTFLRQDPDIIMLGEIRDAETAQMAMRASLTGHLVLSTIHTNSAWGTVSRLIDMNIPPYLLSNTLNLSVAQRLVRKLCVHCKKETKSIEISKKFNLMDEKIYAPTGCPACHHTGYKGRKAIYEIIPVNNKVAESIRNNKRDISNIMQEISFISLKAAAIKLVKSGDTSIDEISSFLD